VTATCLICRREFSHQQGNTVILNQNQAQRLDALTAVLTAHLQSVHPKELGNNLKLIANMAAVGVLCSFDSADPYFIEKRNNAAREIRQAVGRVVTDDDLTRAIVKKSGGLNMMSTKQVLRLLIEMRDYFNYADQATVPTPPAIPPGGPTVA